MAFKSNSCMKSDLLDNCGNSDNPLVVDYNYRCMFNIQ